MAGLTAKGLVAELVKDCTPASIVEFAKNYVCAHPDSSPDSLIFAMDAQRVESNTWGIQDGTIRKSWAFLKASRDLSPEESVTEAVPASEEVVQGKSARKRAGKDAGDGRDAV